MCPISNNNNNFYYKALIIKQINTDDIKYPGYY